MSNEQSIRDAPSINEVRADFIALHTRNFDAYMVGRSVASEQEFYGAQFDSVIRRIQAEVVRQASLRFQMWLNAGGPTPGTEFLNELADRIERGETA